MEEEIFLGEYKNRKNPSFTHSNSGISVGINGVVFADVDVRHLNYSNKHMNLLDIHWKAETTSFPCSKRFENRSINKEVTAVLSQ
jgi:hypothetical protein